MAVLTRDELMKILQEKLTSNDDDLTILENITDTINSMENTENEDWKTKYEENDKAWRERYKARFAEPSSKPSVEEKTPEPDPEPELPKSANYTIDDLFKD